MDSDDVRAVYEVYTRRMIAEMRQQLVASQWWRNAQSMHGSTTYTYKIEYTSALDPDLAVSPGL